MSTYVNISSLLSAILLAILVMFPILAITLTTVMVVTIVVVVIAREKRKKREAVFWAQAEMIAEEAFEEEEIKNYLLEEILDNLNTERFAALDEKEEYASDFDSDFISGKGGKKKYISLMPTHEADDLWWVNYAHVRDGWSRGGHRSGKRGCHDPKYKNHRDEKVRAFKGLDASWYEEEVEAF